MKVPLTDLVFHLRCDGVTSAGGFVGFAKSNHRESNHISLSIGRPFAVSRCYQQFFWRHLPSMHETKCGLRSRCLRFTANLLVVSHCTMLSVRARCTACCRNHDSITELHGCLFLIPRSSPFDTTRKTSFLLYMLARDTGLA